MSRWTLSVVTVLVLWTITAPVTAVGAPTSTQTALSATLVDEGSHTTSSPAQMPGDETVFEEVETNSSSFVMKVNMSLFTTLFQPGSVLRITTGGTANGERVVWFDIGIGRGPDGFELHSDTSLNLPYM